MHVSLPSLLYVTATKSLTVRPVLADPHGFAYTAPAVPISSKDWLNVDELIEVMWSALDLVRVCVSLSS